MSGLVANVFQFRQSRLTVAAKIPSRLAQCFAHEIAKVEEISTWTFDLVRNLVMFEGFNNQRFDEPADHDRAGIVPTFFVRTVDLIGNASDVTTVCSF